jgi:hypothetical protein
VITITWETILISYLILQPVVITAIGQMIISRKNWLPKLAIPIDFNRQLKGKPIFGNSKTWRGIIWMFSSTALISMIFYPAINYLSPSLCLIGCTPVNGLIVGMFIGLGYSLGELPNSFIKRQLGVDTNNLPSTRIGLILMIIGDHIDSSLGGLLLLYIVGYARDRTDIIITAFFIGVILHFIVNLCLWKTDKKALWT